MKSLSTCIILSFVCVVTASAQSDSFQTLKEKFSGRNDVFCFGASGFLARTVLWMAGEHEFNDAVRDIHDIRLIIIPTSAFHARKVSIAGFKKVLRKDSFEELTRVRDHGDDVSVYLKEAPNRDNRYMVLVEDSDNVVVVEFRGYVDPNVIFNHDELSFNGY
jgi:hypothetical protein